MAWEREVRTGGYKICENDYSCLTVVSYLVFTFRRGLNTARAHNLVTQNDLSISKKHYSLKPVLV